MAYSRVVIPGDGSTTLVTATFALGVIDQDDVTVWVSGEYNLDGSKKYRTYTLIGTDQYQINGVAATVDQYYDIRREVTKTELLVNWDDGDAITKSNMNTAQKQTIMIAQEAFDLANSALITDDGTSGVTFKKGEAGQTLLYDENGNIVPGFTGDDISHAQEYAEQAMGYRDQSSGYATQSLGYANQSNTYAGNSLASANLAALWASASYNTIVAAGQYSALHWATVSSLWAESDNIIPGTSASHSAKYWAAQALAYGGFIIGQLIPIYGNGATTPPGCILANGQAVTSTFPELRAFGLANGWPVNGNGDPLTPDMGGQFLRGWRPGQTVDSGRTFGAIQLDSVGPHVHNIGGTGSLGQPTAAAYTSGGGGTAINGAQGAAMLATGSGMGTETRPTNVTCTWYIKAFGATVNQGTIDITVLQNRVTILENKQGIKFGTPVVNPNTASVLFTGIPAGVNRITMKWSDMTVSASALPVIRVGSTTIQSTSYVTSSSGASSSSIGSAGESSGIPMGHTVLTGSFGGELSLQRLAAGSNVWTYRGQTYYAGAASGAQAWSSGKVPMTGELDRIQMTTLAGTALLNGTINISWEY